VCYVQKGTKKNALLAREYRRSDKLQYKLSNSFLFVFMRVREKLSRFANTKTGTRYTKR
jgi:hypothetical protein